MTSYFIKRPVSAVILNLMIVIVGFVCLFQIEIREYPKVDIPIVSIYTFYPNANAEVIEHNITRPLEENISAIEGIESFSSQSKYSNSFIEIKFKKEVDYTGIRDAIAKSYLPMEAEVFIEKKSIDDGMPFIAISVSSDEFEMSELTHYAKTHIQDNLRNIPGIASVKVWGQPYLISIILDPKKLFKFKINPSEVYDILKHRQDFIPLGKFHDVVSLINQQINSHEDFKKIFIKPHIRLSDISDIYLNSDDQFKSRINGSSGIILALSKTSDANPLIVAEEVKKAISKIALNKVKLNIEINKSDFIVDSLNNIKNTIFEAIFLVIVIVFFFLRNARASFIPLITIPISIMGSIIVLKIFGCSINTITLLAIVLSVGLVVDDAIVVLENIFKYLEKGLSPIDAAEVGSKEISFAIIAMTFTLASVYAPIAFIEGGIISQLFREFAIALSASVITSGIVSLTLSPMMCSRMLSSINHTAKYEYRFFFGKKVSILIYFIIVISSIYIFYSLPKELAPKEDRNILGVYIPNVAKDINIQEKKTVEVEKKIENLEGAKSILSFIGDWGSNINIIAYPKKQRSFSMKQMFDKVTSQTETLTFETSPWVQDSGLPGSDDASKIVISSTKKYDEIFNYVESLRQKMHSRGIDITHNLKIDGMGYLVDLDLFKINKLDIPKDLIVKNIELFFSGKSDIQFYKDNIKYYGELKIKDTWDLKEIFLHLQDKQTILVGNIAKMTISHLPKSLHHYNKMRSVDIQVRPKQGQNEQQLMNEVMKEIDSDYKKEILGKNYQSSALLFLLALVFIYGILAMQFESFIDPFIIILTVPFACFGALFTFYLFNQSINIFTQIGIVTLIGLITKHGILIVEFANLSSIEQSLKLRFRPIIMTTAAMVLGAMPLLFATGSGSESRQAMGYVLVGGMVIGTLFTITVFPSIYSLVKRRINKT